MPIISGGTSSGGGGGGTPDDGSVSNVKFTTAPANTLKGNPTDATATPTDLAIAINQVVGRGPTGDLDGLTIGSGLTITDTTLSATAAGTGDMLKATYDPANKNEQVLTITSDLDLANAVEATNANLLTDAELSKLSGVEALADVTDAGNVGTAIHGATAKTTIADADEFAQIDSAASNVLKRITWSSFKTALFALVGVIPTAMMQDNAIGNAKAANMPLGTVKVNNTLVAGDPVDMLLPEGTVLLSNATGTLVPGVLSNKFNLSGNDIDIDPPTQAEVFALADFVLVDADGDPTNEAGTKLNTVPSYTWAAKPSAASNADRWIYITDVGQAKSLWKSNGTRWVPQGNSLDLFRGNWGTIASPTLTRTTVGKYNIGTDPVLPAGFLQLGDELEVYALIRKTGVTGTNTFRLHLGTSATPTSNSLLYGISPTNATDGQEVFVNPVAVVAVVGAGIDTYVTSSRIAKGGTGLANGMEDQGVLFDTATAMTLTANLTTSAGSGDAIHLLYMRVVYRTSP